MMLISKQLLGEVVDAIKRGQVQGQFVLTSKDGKLTTLVSTTADGIFPIHFIKHEEITYYIGIPKAPPM